MRKLIVLLLALLMVFSLASCSNEPEQNNSTTTSDEDTGKENLVNQGAAEGTTAKSVDNKGFKVVGVYQYGETLLNVEVGGMNGVYWIGHDDSYTDSSADPTFTYQFFTEVENTDGSYTIKLWNTSTSVWDEYTTTTSIKDTLFKDGGFADKILYCSFELEGYGFGEAVNAGTTTHEGRECTKFTSSYYVDLSEYNLGDNYKVADANLYVDSDFFVTLDLEIDFTDEFEAAMTFAGLKAEDIVKFCYDVEPNFALTDVDLPDGYSTAYAAL